MPVDKDIKRLVRARMAATRENYTTARAALVPPVDRVDLRALVSQLHDPATAGRAAATLKAQPPERLVPALVAGLGSPPWEGAAQLLPVARRSRLHVRVPGRPSANLG